MRTKLPIICSLIFANIGCGHYPAPLRSGADVFLTSRNEYTITIGALPLRDYPTLKKFEKLKDVNFFTPRGSKVGDSELLAFSTLSFPSLESVCLLHADHVTDIGVQALVNHFRSLKSLQLSGSSITDSVSNEIAKLPNLDGVNVSHCPGITRKGLSTLLGRVSLRDIGFSTENLTTEEIIALVSEGMNITRFEIADPENRIDTAAATKLATLAMERHASIFLRNGPADGFAPPRRLQ